MRLRPIFDRVVIRQLKPEERTSGGIMLPTGTKTEDILRGKVIAVGPGRRNEDGSYQEPVVRTGDVVTFATRVRGAFVKIDGEELLIMEQADILAVVEEDYIDAEFTITDPITGDAHGIPLNGDGISTLGDSEGNR